jgi:hypothetical protein
MEKTYEFMAEGDSYSNMDPLLLGEDFRMQMLFSLWNNIKYVNYIDKSFDSRVLQINSPKPLGCTMYWGPGTAAANEYMNMETLVYDKDMECETYTTSQDGLASQLSVTMNYITTSNYWDKWFRAAVTGLKNGPVTDAIPSSAGWVDSQQNNLDGNHINCNVCSAGNKASNARRNTQSHVTIQAQQQKRDGSWQDRVRTTKWNAQRRVELYPVSGNTETLDYNIRGVQTHSRMETVPTMLWNYGLYAQAHMGTCTAGNNCSAITNYGGSNAYYTITYPKPFITARRNYTLGLTPNAWLCK